MSCIAFESISAGRGSFWGAGLLNFGLDFGIQYPSWRPDIYKDNLTYPFNPFLFVGRQLNFHLHFMPHIDISIAGGLRCHPEQSIFQQIHEVLNQILRNPESIILGDIPVLSNEDLVEPVEEFEP
jgi:hypothetical protein